MYHIALLDDDLYFLDSLYKKLIDYENIKVEGYCDPYDLIEKIVEYDVVMIDYDMPNMTAFQFFEMTSHHRYHKIIITKYDHIIYDSFRYQFFWFIRKRFLEKDFPEMMTNLLETLQKDQKKFIINTHNISISLYYDEIYYIHTDKNYVVVHAIENYRIRSTFKDIVNIINSDDFIIISYGVIVNIRHVKYLDLKKLIIILNNEVQLTISRKYKKKVREKYKEYYLL